MEFDQVIAPLQRNEFLTAHWEKSWLHLPAYMPSDESRVRLGQR